jgi:hypothetical protein
MRETYRLDSYLAQIPWNNEAFQQIDKFNNNHTQSLSDDKSMQETYGLGSCPTQLQIPLDDEASEQMPPIQPNLGLATAQHQPILQQIDLPLHYSISIGDSPLLYHGFKSVAAQDDMIYELK